MSRLNTYYTTVVRSGRRPQAAVPTSHFCTMTPFTIYRAIHATHSETGIYKYTFVNTLVLNTVTYSTRMSEYISKYTTDFVR